MKSVGEVMAIGSNFQESLQKAIRGLEIGRSGLHSIFQKGDMARLRGHLREPTEVIYVSRLQIGCGL